MGKRKNDNYEECLRSFVHSFHARNLKEKREFIRALRSNDLAYAKGYANGLSEALLLLKEIALENDIPLESMGFESTDLNQLLSIVENSNDEY